VDWADAGLRTFSPVAPILGPGFGHQGAEPHQLRARFGALSQAVIASESRSILAAGPDRLAARISERALLYRGE
jgi:orotidine-5'-phosphate decarboxylase